MRAQRMRSVLFLVMRRVIAGRRYSNPAAYASGVCIERGPELAMHFGLLEGYMNPVRGREYQQRYREHRQCTNPERDAARDRDEAEIHGIAREAEWTPDHELLVRLRSRLNFGAFAHEQRESGSRDDKPDHDKCNAEPEHAHIAKHAPRVKPTHRARDEKIDQRPN